MNAISHYINESLAELRQVRWPTRQQAVRFSAIVVVFVAASSIVFGLMDFGLSYIMKTLLQYV